MLAAKILNEKKIRLSEIAYNQYDIASKELNKLSELSSVSWGMITDNYFDSAIRGTLVEGAVYGLILAGGIFVGRKIFTKIKHKNQEEES